MVDTPQTSCCLNPDCLHPVNPQGTKYCSSCGTPLSILRNRYFPTKLLSSEGGFGRTYLAQDTDRLNELCVIKQLAPKVQGTYALQKSKELFQQEAQRLQQLGEHPQIPQLLAYFEEDRYLYLIQQYIRGKRLDKLLHQGVWNEQQVRNFLADILPVLELIHSQHIIHRDIKPQNIIRRDLDGKCVLLDFGASKELVATVVAQGTMIGTSGYGPREQMLQGQAYPASDLYSLGVTCFYLLTGVNPDQLAYDQGYAWVDNWQQFLTQPISQDLEQILSKLLQKEWQHRYPTAKAVVEDLQHPSSSVPPTEPFVPNPVPTPPPLPAVPPPLPISSNRNNSGSGRIFDNSVPVPSEIKGWNWGAFLLGFFWSLRNKVWIGTLSIIPYLGFIMLIILGFKGNEWAWKSRRWSNIQAFKKSQKNWTTAGLIIVTIAFIIGFLIALGET